MSTSIVTPTGIYAASSDWGSTGLESSGGLPERIDRAAGELAALVSGIGESGDFLQKVVDVQVVPQTPLWVVAVLGASVIAAIGSVVLFLIRRRKDRLLTPSPN